MAREIDDIDKRKKYKEKQYDDKKSQKDEYTGERIFKGNKKDAIHRHPVDKVSDTDHITPIKVVENRYKGLTKEQQKILANNEHNYAITNAKLNRSKGGLENHEYLKRKIAKGEGLDLKTSVKMLEKEAESRVAMRTQATVMYSENILHKVKGTGLSVSSKTNFKIVSKKLDESKVAKTDISLQKKCSAKTVKNMPFEIREGVDKALFSKSIPLAIKGIEEIVKVSIGKQDEKQALENFKKTSLNVAKEDVKKKLKVTVTHAMQNSKNSMAKAISQSNLVWQVVEISTVVCRNVGKYINGEITGKEMLNNIKKEGTILATGVICGEAGAVLGSMLCPGIGTVVGELVGQAVGMMVSGIVCNSIVSVYETIKHMDDYKNKEKYVKALEEASVKEMQKQRQKFDSLVENEYKRWDKTIYDGFEKIINYSSEQMYDLKEVTQGLNNILNLFDKQVAFDSLESYEAQLDQPLILKI